MDDEYTDEELAIAALDAGIIVYNRSSLPTDENKFVDMVDLLTLYRFVELLSINRFNKRKENE